MGEREGRGKREEVRSKAVTTFAKATEDKWVDTPSLKLWRTSCLRR